jgi:hypothetical protein
MDKPTPPKSRMVPEGGSNSPYRIMKDGAGQFFVQKRYFGLFWLDEEDVIFYGDNTAMEWFTKCYSTIEAAREYIDRQFEYKKWERIKKENAKIKSRTTFVERYP